MCSMVGGPEILRSHGVVGELNSLVYCHTLLSALNACIHACLKTLGQSRIAAPLANMEPYIRSYGNSEDIPSLAGGLPTSTSLLSLSVQLTGQARPDKVYLC